jgi:hypothetical protein
VWLYPSSVKTQDSENNFNDVLAASFMTNDSKESYLHFQDPANGGSPVPTALTGLTQPARSRDSVVGIATSYGLDDREVGVRVPVGSRIFSSPNRPDRL